MTADTRARRDRKAAKRRAARRRLWIRAAEYLAFALCVFAAAFLAKRL